MSLIDFNDGIKQSIEAASDGMQTVIVTPKGQLSYMTKINKFNMSDIDSSLYGIHPAFIVNGVEKPYILIGTYQGIIKNGEVISQPSQNIGMSDVLTSTLSTTIANMGVGHHVMTAAEWGLVRLLAMKANPDAPVLGNTYYGRSSLDATQYGRRADGLDATSGITTGNTTILTGSGPVRFRHNQKYNGVSDIVGNRHQPCSGIRLVAGEIQFLANNNAAATPLETQYTDAAAWRALDGVTGAFVNPGHVNSVKFATLATASSNVPAYTLVTPSSTSNSTAISAITNPSSIPVSLLALNTLRAYGVITLANAKAEVANGNISLPSGYLTSVAGTHYATVGGSVNSGLYSQTFSDWVANATQSVRPCFYP